MVFFILCVVWFSVMVLVMCVLFLMVCRLCSSRLVVLWFCGVVFYVCRCWFNLGSVMCVFFRKIFSSVGLSVLVGVW